MHADECGFRGGRWWRWRRKVAPYVFVSPFVVLFGLFMLYPLVRSIVLSLHRTVGPKDEVFVGLANYLFLVRDALFWWSVLNTAGFVVAFLAIQIPASLGLAILLNSRRVRGRAVFRFAFFSTYLTGSVFVAVVFALLLSPRHGLVNRALSVASGETILINWLGDPRLAMVSVLIAALWLSIGFGMIFFLAGLQAIDPDLYEAAAVDGAGAWRQFLHVTLPGVRPVMIFLLVFGTIGAFQLFELPWVLFNQSPGPNSAAMTVVMYLFLVGFATGDLGYASAIGWAMAVLILGVALVQVRLTGALRRTP